MPRSKRISVPQEVTRLVRAASAGGGAGASLTHRGFGAEPDGPAASNVLMSFLPYCKGITFRSPRRGLPAAAVAALLLAWSAPAAAEAPALVRTMLDNAPAAAEARCSYVRTKIDDEDDTKQERYRAGASGTQWELIGVDGRAPTEAELRRYARGADDRERRHPLAFDLREMVDPDHWQLELETDTEVIYQFRLRSSEDLDERLVEKVIGTLVVDKIRRQPVRITIQNTEPAYVAPFVRVTEYVQEMQFRWDESVGAAVLTQTSTRWNGRALGLKPLSRRKLVRYSDYECAGEIAGAD